MKMQPFYHSVRSAILLLCVALVTFPKVCLGEHVEFSSGSTLLLLFNSDSEAQSFPASNFRLPTLIRISERFGDIVVLKSEQPLDEVSFCTYLKHQVASLKSCSKADENQKNFAAPNDPYYSFLWGLPQIGATYSANVEPAWAVSTGSRQVVVAIIDTGIDYYHPDLLPNIWTNPWEIPANGVDDDGNGYVDDMHGINGVLGDGDPLDNNGHGTHVAGTIGAAGNNGLGVPGVCWNVSIIAISAGFGASISQVAEIRGYRYLLDLKARGVNIVAFNGSFGGPGASEITLEYYHRLADAGIIAVIAAGNEQTNVDESPTFPCNYDSDNIVCVAALDQQGDLAYFSNYGKDSVDIAAPGLDILSTTPGGTYKVLPGTSMATPHVTGALALYASAYPRLHYRQYIQALNRSARRLPSIAGLVRNQAALDVGAMLFVPASTLTPEVAPTPVAASTPAVVTTPPTPQDTHTEVALTGSKLISTKNQRNVYRISVRPISSSADLELSLRLDGSSCVSKRGTLQPGKKDFTIKGSQKLFAARPQLWAVDMSTNKSSRITIKSPKRSAPRASRTELRKLCREAKFKL